MVSNVQLWERIDRFSFKELGQGAFFKALVSKNGWSAKFARRAIREYKKFMYLAVVSSSCVSPSKIVDTVWHTHLTYTKNYWNEFCPNVLEKTIHHHPSEKTGESKAANQNNFQKTLELYKHELGVEPPKLIWNHAARNLTKAIFFLVGITAALLWFIGVIPQGIAIGLLVADVIAYNYVMGMTWASEGEFDLDLFDFTDCGTADSSGDGGDSGGGDGGCGGD